MFISSRAAVAVLCCCAVAQADDATWPAMGEEHIEMPTPVFAGTAYVGEVFTLIEPQTGMPSGVDQAELRQLWEQQNWVLPDEGTAQEGGFMPMSAAGAWAPVRWSAEEAAIIFDVPAQWLEQEQTQSDGYTAYVREAQQWVEPAALSGYLNLRARGDVGDSSQRGTVRAESMLNFRGVAWRGDLSHSNDDGSSETHLEHASLTLERGLWAYSAGDWQAASRGMQVAPTITGLHISRGVRRWSELVRGSSDTFVVDSPSTVEIWQDGQLVSTRTLERGTYTYREFGIVAGDITTQARIRDEAGKVRELTGGTYSEILDKGQWAGSLSFGLARERSQDSIWGDYGARLFGSGTHADSNNALFHGFVDYGLGGQIEGTLTAQSDSYGGRIGVGLGSEHTLGQWRIAARGHVAGTAHYDESKTAAGAYGALSASSDSLGSLSVSGSYRAAHFDYPQSREQWGASVGYSFSHGQWVHSLTGTASGFAGAEVDTSYRYAVSRRMGDWRLGASVRATDSETQAYFTLSWTPRTTDPTRRWSVYGSAGTESAQGTLTHDRSQGAMRYGGSLSASHTFDAATAGDAYGYFYNPYLIASTNLATVRDAAGDTSANASVSFASALAFADGQWALTRPLDDSFVLVKTHPTWRENGISSRINPDNWGGFEGRAGAWSAVLPVQAHPEGSTVMIATDGDAMLSLDRGDFRARPGPNRGSVLVVGDDKGTMVMGILLLADRTPLRKTRVRLVHASGEVLSTFTSSAGRFSAGPMQAGRWTVQTRDEVMGSFDTTELERDEFGLVDVGSITLLPAGEPTVPAQPVPAVPQAAATTVASAAHIEQAMPVPQAANPSPVAQAGMLEAPAPMAQNTGQHTQGTQASVPSAGVYIAGQLTDEGGSPIALRRVRFERAQTGEVVIALTNAQGRFSAGPLSNGVWHVRSARRSAVLDTAQIAECADGLAQVGKVPLHP